MSFAKQTQKPRNDQFKVVVNGIEQIFDPGGLMVSNCFLCVSTELHKDISQYFRGKNSRLQIVRLYPWGSGNECLVVDRDNVNWPP